MDQADEASRWRCVLIGGETLLIECARMLEERGHEIVAIVSRNADIRDWAAARSVPVLEASGILMHVGLAPFDYLFSVANLAILPPDVLALPRRGAINFHDGPLPGRGGVNAPVWALLDGERQHEVTWHLMSGEVDQGDILATANVELDEADTAFSANTKCFAAAVESFAVLLDGLADGALAPRPQGEAMRRYRGRADRPCRAATIDWYAPADEIVRLVRALDHGGHANPLGLPKFGMGGVLHLVRAARVEAAVSGVAPGTVVDVGEGRLTVASGTAGVVIERITTLDGQPADLTAMAGRRMDMMANEQARLIDELDAAAARHERWWRRRLAARSPYLLPQIDRSARAAGGAFRFVDLALPMADDAEPVMAALTAYLARLADKAEFDLGFIDPVFAARFEGAENWFARQVPLAVRLDFGRGLAALGEELAEQICQLHRHVGHAADLPARCPELVGPGSALPVAIVLVDRLEEAEALPGSELTIAVRGDGGATRWIHDEALLDRASVRAMQQGFEALLAAALAAPDRPLAELPVMGEALLGTVIEGWNDTAVAWREGACIHHLFTEQAARTPDRPAVTCRGRTLSYAELDARSNQLARHLTSLGVGPDVLVGLHLARSVEMLVALVAIHKAGGAYVPLDPDYPADRIAHMIEDAGAPVILSQSDLAPGLPATAAHIIRIDRDAPLIARQPAEPVDGGARPHHLAYVIYTSGSTGRPKGVMVEHRNVANFFAGVDAKIEPEGVWLSVTSLSFDISVLELCWTLARGFHIVIATGENLAFDGARRRGAEIATSDATLAGLMTRHRVTHLQCTPSMAQMLVADQDARSAMAGLRRMMVGGEAFPPALARELRGLVGGVVMNMYGPTETTIWSTVQELDGTDAGVPLGRPLANQQVYILDSRQQPLPPGIPGELVIGGRGVVRGYLHRPELTAERFIAHPFHAGERAYRTGDLARRLADGTLEFLGRLDHQVKIRGYRIELGEIEAVLADFPGVEQTVVVAREDRPGDVRLVGYYTGAASSPAELRAHLQARLPDFMVPAHLVPLATLPKTPNGKIARNALPQPIAELITTPGEPFAEPAEGVEAQIAAIWRDVLKLPRVGKRDNFFDLGGHSLLAVQVHRRLRASFARPLSITDVFRFPTIEALSAHLGGADHDDEAVRQGEARAASRRAALQRRRGMNLQIGAGEGS